MDIQLPDIDGLEATKAIRKFETGNLSEHSEDPAWSGDEAGKLVGAERKSRSIGETDDMQPQSSIVNHQSIGFPLSPWPPTPWWVTGRRPWRLGVQAILKNPLTRRHSSRIWRNIYDFRFWNGCLKYANYLDFRFFKSAILNPKSKIEYVDAGPMTNLH